jgi:hypothetical protein
MTTLKKYDLSVGNFSNKDGSKNWYVSAHTHYHEILGSASGEMIRSKFLTKKEAVEWARSLTKEDVKKIIDERIQKSLESYRSKKSVSK